MLIRFVSSFKALSRASGVFLVSAIESRDFPKVQAVVILATLLFVSINLVIDLIYRSLAPRIGGENA